MGRHRVLSGALAGIFLVLIGTLFGTRQFNRSELFHQSRDRAEEAHRAGRWSLALAECERALEIKSDGGLERLASDSRRNIEAERRKTIRSERYRRLQVEIIQPLAAKIQEMRPYFYLKEINLRRKLSEVERTLEEMELVAADPDYAEFSDLWRLIGVGWYFVGNIPRAERALTQSIQLDPQDGEGNFYLGRIYLERAMAESNPGFGESKEEVRARVRRWTEKALVCLRRPPRNEMGSSEIYRHIAKTYLSLAEGDREGVLRLFRQGLERFPKELGTEEYWVLLARIRVGRSAIAALNRAIARRPQYAWAYFMRGVLHHGARRLGAAIRDYSRAIDINPRMAAALIYRGKAHGDRGNHAAAMKDLNEGIRIRPGGARAYLHRGTEKSRAGDPVGALADFEQAVRANPRCARAFLGSARIRTKRGEFERAIRDLDAAIRIAPNHPPTLRLRGKLWLRLGNLRNGIGDLERAGMLTPNSEGNPLASLFHSFRIRQRILIPFLPLR